MWPITLLKALLMIFPIIKEFINGKHGMLAYVKEHPFPSFLFFSAVIIFLAVIGLFMHGLKLQGLLYEAKLDIVELQSENKVLRHEISELIKHLKQPSQP